MKTLVVYPHGLGDCILFTPVLREYYERYGIKPSIAIKEKFRSAELFKNSPYVDMTFPVLKDPNQSNGQFSGAFEQGALLGKEQGFECIFLVQHTGYRQRICHKLDDCERCLGVKVAHRHTEVWINAEEQEIAKQVIDELVGNNSFGFVHSQTDEVEKSLPEGYGRDWLLKHKGINHVIEPSVTFPCDKFNINVQFEIARQADAVCVADSVFYHGCCAMDKKIDLAYFYKGPGVYQQVRSLFPVKAKVVFDLEVL
jgi:hypothetical protein